MRLSRRCMYKAWLPENLLFSTSQALMLQSFTMTTYLGLLSTLRSLRCRQLMEDRRLLDDVVLTPAKKPICSNSNVRLATELAVCLVELLNTRQCKLAL